jgi:hypothetical protein
LVVLVTSMPAVWVKTLLHWVSSPK